jgi:bifunctional non-homologous end joining protein LigD
MARQLAEYRRKRRFDETPEPSGDGGSARRGRASGARARHSGARANGARARRRGARARRARRAPAADRFVVHEHHARRLHWDLRLERDGVLVSWAIPNGIPEDPRQNRKAVHVEDHPLDYIDFKGTIPQGSYGAGEVTIWDSGTYTVEKWERKKLVVAFDGKQLTGRYALFQAGRSEKDWMIHRMDPPADPTAAEMPDFVEPMLARLATMPRDEANWSFEVKWDGVRAIAHSQPGRIHLTTRNGNDVTSAFPELRALNRALGSHSAILDGEIVAFDAEGRPSFQALQPRIHLRGDAAVRRRAAEIPVTYAIFDLLWLDGHSLMELPYSERRDRLADLRLEDEHWRVPQHHPGAGSALLRATGEQRLEGIVAKRLDSRYEPGRRSGAWVKVKNVRRQEVVVGGWLPGQGARRGRLGALLAGVYEAGEGEADEPRLRFVGRVGTGFGEAELRRLGDLLEPLRREENPFALGRPPREAIFCAPELVAEVGFSEWTRSSTLRAPRYLGLRDDRDPREVAAEPLSAGAEPAGATPTGADGGEGG